MSQKLFKRECVAVWYGYFLCFLLLLPASALLYPREDNPQEHLGQTSEGPATKETAIAPWLTTRDRRWLKEHAILRHGIVDGHKPFEYIDADGVYRGLTSDYIKIIGEQLGISFETVVTREFETLSKYLDEERVDISSYLPPAWVEPGAISDSIIQMPIVMFARQEAALITGLDALDKERVVVEKPSRAQELLSRDFPEMPLLYVETPAEGLRAVENGDADIFIHNVFSVEYYQRKLNLKPLKIVSTTPYVFTIKFAVNRDLVPLIPMIHKVIAGLSEREKRLIFDKWINVEVERRLDFRSIFYWGGGILLLLMLVFSVILHWNKLLKVEVHERTREIEKSSQELRNLARHMDKVREEEKAILAREIHDELGHALTALIMSVRQLGHLVRKDKKGESRSSGAILDQLDELSTLVRKASNTSRRIISDLRPSVLEDLGLLAATEWLVHEFETHYGKTCRIRATDISLTLSDGATTALFRIVQESLTNIAKHADAKNVEITMACGDDWFTLQISDDGKGLDSDWEGKDGCYGLQGMRERVLGFGGELSLTNGQTGGASLRVQIPLTS